MSRRNLMETARALLQDDEVSGLLTVLHEAPERMEEIRERAQEVDPEEARQAYQDLSDTEQTQLLDNVVSRLAVTFAQLRSDPVEGVEQLASEIRDPWTMEALLLIFDNDEHIDPEYSEDVKEYIRWRVRWLAIEALPEAYTDDEIREVADRFGLETEEVGEDRTNA